MNNSILNYKSEKEYLLYLDTLDSSALLNEFYACHRLRKAVKSRLKRVCKASYNHYCNLLVDIDYNDITRFDYYLIRVLLRFELFVKRQFQHINGLCNFYDPRPIHFVKSKAPLDSLSVLEVYSETMQEFHCLEKIVSSFEKKTKIWMYFLYGRGDIPEMFKTEECRKSICAVNLDGSYDFRYQLELVYKELVRIIETEMNCDILVFKDKGVRYE